MARIYFNILTIHPSFLYYFLLLSTNAFKIENFSMHSYRCKVYSYQFLRCLISYRAHSARLQSVRGRLRSAVIHCCLPVHNGFKFSRLNSAPNTRYLQKNVPAHNRNAMLGFVRPKNCCEYFEVLPL